MSYSHTQAQNIINLNIDCRNFLNKYVTKEIIDLAKKS